MAFCSLLVDKSIFKEVTIGFLIIGHTYMDLDAHFNYPLELLKQKNMYVLTACIIPSFHEIVDFISYVKNFHHEGAN
jgi:hypothetical protein